VRAAAVTLLGRALATAPRARKTLALVARTDAKPQIRKLAAKLLAPQMDR
jgi:hypothetical protein